MDLTEKEKSFLLGLARRAIEHYFKTKDELDIKPGEIPSERMMDDGACFVTLYIGKHLRGCIGSLEAKRPLCRDVVKNALHASFGDPRFYQLKKEELDRVKITISVLTPPKPLEVSGPDDLLKKLAPNKHGVILENGLHRATYLPAVWEQLPKKEEFLSELSVKAGMEPEGWKDPETRFFVYEAIEISE